MPVDGVDEDGSPEVLDAPTRAPLDNNPVIERRAEIREVDSADRPERDPDGGWRWKSLELSPHANRVAEAGLALRREAEGRDPEGNYTDRGITPAMRRIETGLEQGSLVPDTERFALKSPDRFKEKLAKTILDQPDGSPEEICASIHDGIRYTFTIDEHSYATGVRSVLGQLESNGYEPLVLKNTWECEEYKGINTRWRDGASNTVFEVQFHTQRSWEAKQQTHEAYEAISDLRTPTVERERLRAFQREVNEHVQVPHGALEIAQYRQEGW